MLVELRYVCPYSGLQQWVHFGGWFLYILLNYLNVLILLITIYCLVLIFQSLLYYLYNIIGDYQFF